MGDAGDVATTLEAVQHAGQRGGARAHCRSKLRHIALPAVGQVGQDVDLGRRQLEPGQLDDEDLDRRMGCPLEREHR